MTRLKDLTDKVYGNVTVKYMVGKDRHGKPVWMCRCNCGGLISYSSSALKNPGTRHCGCMFKKDTKRDGTKIDSLESDDKPMRPIRRSRSMLCQPMLSDAFKFFKVLNECRA